MNTTDVVAVLVAFLIVCAGLSAAVGFALAVASVWDRFGPGESKYDRPAPLISGPEYQPTRKDQS